MRRILAAMLVVLIGVQPSLLRAQQSSEAGAPRPSPPPQTPGTSTPQSAATGVPDVAALGLSFDRIKRLLADRAPSETKSTLKLNYYVEVVALAPRIQLFTREDLAPRGVVPWGAPTHADIVRILTPVEFRAPTVPIGSLAVLGILKLVEWETARMKRQKAEDERAKRNEDERKRQKALEGTSAIIVK
jgi:hypothetical protein